METWTDLPVISMKGLGRERDAQYKAGAREGRKWQDAIGEKDRKEGTIGVGARGTCVFGLR